MGELLVEARAASQADVDAALADQSAGEPSRLGEILLAQGKLTPLALAQGLAVQLSLPFTDLAYVAPEASDLVPLEFQRAHKIVPFRVDEENGVRRVHVAVADPTLQDVIDELRAQLKSPVVVHVASVEDVEAVHSALGGDVVAGALIEGSIIDDVGANAAGGDLFGGPLMDLSAEPQAPLAGLDSDPFGSFGGADGPGSLETTVPMQIAELPPRRPGEGFPPSTAFADDPLAAYDTLLAEPAALEPLTADPVFELPVSAESAIDVSSFEIDAPVASDQQALAAVADDAEALDGILVDEPEHDPVTAIGVSPALVDATKEEPELVTAIKFSPALVAATRGGSPNQKAEKHPTEADLFGDLEPVSAEPLTADLVETIGSDPAPAPAGLMGALQPVAPIMPPLPKVAMSPPPPVIPKHNAIPSFAILPDDPLLPDLQPAPPRPPPPKMSPGPQPTSSPSALGRIALKRVAVVTPADGGPARTVEIPRAAIVDSAERAKAEFAAAERALEAAAKKAEAEQAARAKAKAEAAAAETARAQAAAEKARLEALERERVEAEERAKAEAEARAQAEAEARAAEEAAAKARAEAEEQARLEADAKAREEEEAKARAQAEAKARADAEFERLKQEAAAKAKARAQEQAAARAKAKAEAEAAEQAKAEAEAARLAEEERQKAEAEAARLAEEERQKAEAEAARLAEEQQRTEAEALARAEASADQAKAEAELAQARAEAEAAEAAARLEAEKAAAAEIAAAQVEPVPDDLGSADTEVRVAELPKTVETNIPIPPEAVPSTAPPPDNFVLPDWMKVPGEAPPAYLDPKATTTAGLKRLLDSIETASPLEQGRMLAALVKLLVERGLLDVKEVIAALNKP